MLYILNCHINPLNTPLSFTDDKYHASISRIVSCIFLDDFVENESQALNHLCTNVSCMIKKLQTEINFIYICSLYTICIRFQVDHTHWYTG